MATNIEIDPELIERAMRLGGKRTKKGAVAEALEEYVRRREQMKIIELFGEVEIDPSYDYKAQRKRPILVVLLKRVLGVCGPLLPYIGVVIAAPTLDPLT